MHELDDELRLVVTEPYFEGHSAAEIARRHRIPAGTVRWRLQSALDRLRVALDTQFGGRRALWAGLVPSTWPTLSSPAASGLTATDGVLTAVGRGVLAVNTKMMLGSGVATTTLFAGVLWTPMETDEPPDRARPSMATTAASVEVDSRRRTPRPSPDARDELRDRWQQRRAPIYAAHAQAPEPIDHALTGARPGDDPGGSECATPGCVESLRKQLLELLEGYREFMLDRPNDLLITASIVGTPEEGTLVEDIELDAAEDTTVALRECLTESMDTLDLGPVTTNVDQQITVVADHSMEDIESLVDHGILEASPPDPPLRDAIRTAMGESSDVDPTGMRVYRIGGSDSDALSGGSAVP